MLAWILLPDVTRRPEEGRACFESDQLVSAEGGILYSLIRSRGIIITRELEDRQSAISNTQREGEADDFIVLRGKMFLNFLVFYQVKDRPLRMEKSWSQVSHVLHSYVNCYFQDDERIVKIGYINDLFTDEEDVTSKGMSGI